ncbi:hypothetical protein GCM10025779_07430 [Arthrobacter cryoconiti]
MWLGLSLLLKPLSSLEVLTFYVGVSCILSGLLDLLSVDESSENRARSATRLLLGWGWVVAGVLVLVWVGGVFTVLPAFVAVALIASGLGRGLMVVRTVRANLGSPDERAATMLLAGTDLLLGVVALAWPDVTLLIVAVLFGARMVLFGLGRVWYALFVVRTGLTSRARSAHGPFRRWMRVTGALLSLVLAGAAGALGAKLDHDSPEVSAFYDAPPTVPSSPGMLLKSEPFTTSVPLGARAWRILYTTTSTDGSATVASAVVLTSTKAASEPRPVITWAHGTTGYTSNCAPSIVAASFASGALPALDSIVENGWVLVAPDYTGLGTKGPQPYLIGQGQARSVLDGVRAARALDARETELSMADSTVVWGHSQGGQAALWTGGLAPSYAPDVKISGVAAMAPASDAIGLVKNLPSVSVGSVFASYVAAAYSDTYPDVNFNEYITPAARTLVHKMSTRCLSEPGALVSVVNALAIDKDRTIFAKDPTTGALGERLRENIPELVIPEPLLIAQGAADALVIPAVQDAYVAARCASGQKLDYRKYAGKDHLSVVAPDSPLIGELLSWTKDRIAGLPATSNCGTLP